MADVPPEQTPPMASLDGGSVTQQQCRYSFQGSRHRDRNHFIVSSSTGQQDQTSERKKSIIKTQTLSCLLPEPKKPNKGSTAKASKLRGRPTKQDRAEQRGDVYIYIHIQIARQKEKQPHVRIDHIL